VRSIYPIFAAFSGRVVGILSRFALAGLQRQGRGKPAPSGAGFLVATALTRAEPPSAALSATVRHPDRVEWAPGAGQGRTKRLVEVARPSISAQPLETSMEHRT